MLETSLAYDNGVRTTSMVDVSGTSSWTYNAADEITDLNTPQGDVDYTYNLAGQILTLVDVGTGTTTNTYDSAGRPATTTDAFGDVSSYSYDSAGRLSQKNNPNGTYEVYTYDSRSRVTSIVTKNSSNAVLQSRVYTFDLASQVTQVVEGGVTTTYGYDNIGQLTSESKSSGYSGAYTYDANGNRLTRTVNSVTENYSYDSVDKLTGITGGSDARSFTYDAAGRTTGIVRSSGTTAFSYDYESRVTSITKPGMTTNSFSYNGLDTRVGLVDSSGTKSFKRAGVGVTAPVLSDWTASFTPSGEKRGSVKTTFHSALKNDDVQTSASQVVSGAKQFDAFGNELSGSGSWKSQFGYAGGFGYQSDPDSGLKLLGHRYYDSDTGRFLTRDPIKDGRNWYAYCGNNPGGYYDNEGFMPQRIQEQVVLVEMAADSAGGIGTVAGRAAAQAAARDILMKVWGWYYRLPPWVQQGLTMLGIGPHANGRLENGINNLVSKVQPGKQQLIAHIQSATPVIGRSLPREGPPNSVSALVHPQSGQVVQVRINDPMGKWLRDIDWGHDHGFGNPHWHAMPGGIRDWGNPFKLNNWRVWY